MVGETKIIDDGSVTVGEKTLVPLKAVVWLSGVLVSIGVAAWAFNDHWNDQSRKQSEQVAALLREQNDKADAANAKTIIRLEAVADAQSKANEQQGRLVVAAEGTNRRLDEVVKALDGYREITTNLAREVGSLAATVNGQKEAISALSERVKALESKQK